MEVHNPDWDPEIVFSSDALGLWGCGVICIGRNTGCNAHGMAHRQKYSSERTITYSACLCNLGEAMATQKSVTIV